jgi:hypothetical protein
MFPIYGGKCLSCKAIQNWVEKFSQGHLKVTNDETGVELAGTNVSVLVEDMSRNKCFY